MNCPVCRSRDVHADGVWAHCYVCDCEWQPDMMKPMLTGEQVYQMYHEAHRGGLKISAGFLNVLAAAGITHDFDPSRE